MSRRSFTFIGLATIATVGLWEGAKGVVLPHFLNDLHLSPAVGAAIFSAGGLGHFLSSSSFGTLSHRVGLKRVVLIGMGLVAVMLSLFMTAHQPVILYATMALLSMGGGMIELSTSLPISILYGEKQGGMLNLLHGLFGTGALTGTLLGAALVTTRLGWRAPLLIMGALLLAWGLIYQRQPALLLPESAGEAAGGFAPLLRDPLVWAAALAICAVVGAEVGIGLWLPYYLQQSKGLTEAASALSATLFFMGFTTTRLLGTWLVNRVGAVQSVLGLAVLGLFSLSALLALPGAYTWIAALAGAGIAIGFSTSIALVSRAHPARVNRVYSLMYSCAGIAGIVTGPFMGWVGARAGLTVAMVVPLSFYGLLVIAMVAVHTVQRRQQAYVAL
jgi:FHS family glucose/mannose:H+ symporter-like MFS transporter